MGGVLFFKIFFIHVLLSLYAKFKTSTKSGSGQKVCGGGWWVVETNYSVKLKLKLNNIPSNLKLQIYLSTA